MKHLILFLILFTSSLAAQTVKDYQFVSPVPGSELNSRESTIIIRQGTEIDPSSLTNAIEVLGSKSGKIEGEIFLSSDKMTIIFKPANKLQPDEIVNVNINNKIETLNDKTLKALEFSFKVTPLEKRLNPREYLSDQYYDGKTGSERFGKIKDDSLEADFPNIRTDVTGETGEGYIFLTVSRMLEGVGYYIMMLDNDATPFYYKKLPDDYAYNFTVQPNGLFSYSQFLEHFTYTGGGNVKHMVMDNSFTVIDSFQMGNGYDAEAHDFKLLPNGNALLFGYDLQPMDLTEYGGYPNALVAGTVVQELDNEKNVIFQWRSWDHYQFSDTYFSRITNSAFDPVHINSITQSNDGHILVTSNGLQELTKINRQTGDIIWRFGGKNNQFTFIGEDASFDGGLHNITQLENGNITFFDNPARPTGNARAVEYDLDEENLTATLVWAYVPEPEVHGFRRGSVQRLPNGNTIIGWGSASDADSLAVTEVTPDKEVVFQLYFEEEGLSSYRAFRFPFPAGTPAASVTQFEVAQGNTYMFEEGDSNKTGIDIKINEMSGEGYNEVIVERYNFAPRNPVFFGKSPFVEPERIVVSQIGINSISSEIQFDVDFYNIENPDEYIIYNREFPGNGLFEPLETSYNQVTKKLIGSADKLGEFIIAKPDFESIAFAPKPFAPADSEKVNVDYSTTLRWNPIGYVEDYYLEVARDSNFTDLVFDRVVISEALFQVDGLEAETTYFWRVKALNDAGESEWSQTFQFVVSEPFLFIKSPEILAKMQRGLEHFIVWEDNVKDSIIVEIKKMADEFAFTFRDTLDNTGAYKWDIPSDLELGFYNVKVKDLDTTALDSIQYEIVDSTTGVLTAEKLPTEFVLRQNYPNPFNPSTIISFDLPKGEFVKLKIFDILGREVSVLIDAFKDAGRHNVEFNASKLTSGIYFYSIETKSLSKTRKMLLMK